jgi:chromosome segregation ATPase
MKTLITKILPRSWRNGDEHHFLLKLDQAMFEDTCSRVTDYVMNITRRTKALEEAEVQTQRALEGQRLDQSERDKELKDALDELKQCRRQIHAMEEDAIHAAEEHERVLKRAATERENMNGMIQALTDQRDAAVKKLQQLENRMSLENLSQEYSSRELRHLTIQNIKLRKQLADVTDAEPTT